MSETVSRSPRLPTAAGAAATPRDAARRANLVGLGLFLALAWPLLLTEVPPYQDVPNHLATATVLANPSAYPEFVSNGFFKTNAALFAWLHLAPRALHVSITVALKLFVAATLATSAFAWPRFVLARARAEAPGDPAEHRARVTVAGLVAFPMVHNWFVAMGMLDFALAVPLALFTLTRLEAQRVRPSLANAASVTGLAFATWYAHVFPLLVVHLLVLVEASSTVVRAVRARAGEPSRGAWDVVRDLGLDLARFIAPLLPTTALVLTSLARQIKDATEPIGEVSPMAGRFLPVWELAYNLWAEWLYGFTWLELGSLVSALVLAFYAFRNRGRAAGFFSPAGFAVLAAFYVLSPYVATSWFHLNSRFIPFLWAAALARLPARLPRPLTWALGLAFASYVVGLGVDFVRLDREQARFTEGVRAVPVGATLLPLLFTHKSASDNTHNVMHLWGLYVVAKHTSAPLLFAHSRSFPVSYRDRPPARFNDLALEPFAPSMGTPGWTCAVLHGAGLPAGDCVAVWRERWAEFWADATPRFSHVLAWDMPPESRALVPPSYRPVFDNGRLVVFARGRRDAARASAPPAMPPLPPAGR